LLTVDAERVTDLEYRDGYNERGCAERFPRLELPQALHLATRICGTCSVAHGLAFCQTIETLCTITVPERAQYLRVVAAELERIASHLNAAATILETIGMLPTATRLYQLREQSLAAQQVLSGSRVMPDFILPGGVRRDLNETDRAKLQEITANLNRSLFQQIDQLIDQPALPLRTVGIGTLPRAAAEQFGIRGPLARASGVTTDLRVLHPYAAYSKLACRVITQDGGDVYARLMVLLLEALESTKLIEQALRDLPTDDWHGTFPADLTKGHAASGVEGPHGMIRYHIESDGRRLSQVQIDAPRQLDRLLARTFLIGSLLENVIPIITSCDVCTACAEH
jgi:Ni,Fe-hydrogenase III large subunit